MAPTSSPPRAKSSARRKPSARARAKARAARRHRWAVGLAVGVVVASAGAVGVFAVRQGTASALGCVDERSRYSAEQLANAETILAAGRDAGLAERDQTIAVMTAMGESSLRNLDYGDWETSGVTNPDGSRTTSIGLFQQQDGWGSREERLDPYTSATLFYRAMVAKVPDRANVEPTLVAHRTQINRDPQHYAPYWERAERLVDAIDGAAGCR